MEENTWTVQGSVNGKTWRDMTSPYTDRDASLDRLQQFRAAAQPSVRYRLVRDTTVVTRSVEEA
ncbi:hypothetical protein ACIPXV_09360 [Streptomyces libani]|uniref:hypothetical protein n=1 Tax=Streptomyces nigrescens TaxID=1920 RepID=UPI003820A270